MWSPTHVQVTVQRARNLQNKGRKGTNDAFVLIQMGKEKFQTSVKEKTADPEWYEECDLTLIGRDSDVILTVFHRNVLGLDEFLGQTAVSLEGIENFDRPFTKWYPLRGKTSESKEKNRGELEVKVAFIVQRCNDTQSLNDLSIKKKKHSIKNLATSMTHKLQKLPSRSLSLRNLDPRKRIEKIREKHASESSALPEEYDDEVFPPSPIKRNGSLYSSTLSLPQSAMITSSIKEDEDLEELPHQKLEDTTEQQHITDEYKIVNTPHLPKPPARKPAPSIPETRAQNHGEWTNRVLAHIKESPIARSETNLMEALKAETPIIPARKSKLGNLRHNIRRHTTFHLTESPDLLASTTDRKNRLDILKCDASKNNLNISDGIPTEVFQQFEKMNHKDLVLLAIKQQADLERQRDRIIDLENYLDNLLVRVMETTPRILQKPYISPSCSR